jgi:hypothetical protein
MAMLTAKSRGYWGLEGFALLIRIRKSDNSFVFAMGLKVVIRSVTDL